MRDLDSLCSSSCTSSFSRRLSRTERAFNDPIREMEGMLVDEYGRCKFVEALFYMLINISSLSVIEFYLIASAIQVFSSRVSVCPACSRMKMREVILTVAVLKL